MYSIVPYKQTYRNTWNNFLSEAKNAHFLFNRNFMEYHQDRFQDGSLLFYKKSKLVALFPANTERHICYSHQGLTYAGLVLDKKLTNSQVFMLFEALRNYLAKHGFRKLIYKQAPDYQSTVSCQELQALFFTQSAMLVRCDSCSVINLQSSFDTLQHTRSIKKAQNTTHSILEETNYTGFWDILTHKLNTKFNTKPVHSITEITYLARLFPNNIKHYTICDQGVILAGVVLFINDYTQTVHVQYMAQNEEGQRTHALYALLLYLIKQFAGYRYFSLGTSNIPETGQINWGLLRWKEKFGARSFVHYTYSYDIINEHTH